MTVELLTEDGQAAFANMPCGSSTNLGQCSVNFATGVYTPWPGGPGTTSSMGRLTLNVLLSLCPVRARGHR
jgi:hypothetical protein